MNKISEECTYAPVIALLGEPMFALGHFLSSYCPVHQS